MSPRESTTACGLLIACELATTWRPGAIYALCTIVRCSSGESEDQPFEPSRPQKYKRPSAPPSTKADAVVPNSAPMTNAAMANVKRTRLVTFVFCSAIESEELSCCIGPFSGKRNARRSVSSVGSVGAINSDLQFKHPNPMIWIRLVPSGADQRWTGKPLRVLCGGASDLSISKHEHGDQVDRMRVPVRVNWCRSAKGPSQSIFGRPSRLWSGAILAPLESVPIKWRSCDRAIRVRCGPSPSRLTGA